MSDTRDIALHAAARRIGAAIPGIPFPIEQPLAGFVVFALFGRDDLQIVATELTVHQIRRLRDEFAAYADYFARILSTVER